MIPNSNILGAFTVILRQSDSAIQSQYFSNDYMSAYKIGANYFLSILETLVETLVETMVETTVKDDYSSFNASMAKTDFKYSLYSIKETSTHTNYQTDIAYSSDHNISKR